MPLDKSSPLHPPRYENADLGAFRALAEGVATEAQQKRALSFIVNDLCGTYDLAYRPDSRETDLALGKQFVGQQIVKLTKLKSEVLK